MSGSSSTPTITSFTQGDIVISVVGNVDGNGPYADNAATPIMLEEIDPTTGAIVGQMELPETTTVVNGVTENAISGEYGSSSEGSLQLAANGQSLVIAGYGVNDVAYNNGGAAVYGNAALGQTTSVPGGPYTVVPRVIADISYSGKIDTSTALYNVFNTNNPRSVATVDGSSFWISGQGVKGDTTQGVFAAKDGALSATAIDTANDTRTVEIYNGQLYVSQDSTQPKGTGTSSIASFGGLPASANTPVALTGINRWLTLTAAQTNTVNASAVGTQVNISPENFFFANATTLYVADGGNPKEGTVGDGGLQKYVYDAGSGSWVLQYTLSAGLNLVQNPTVDPSNTAGTTGLIGLTGVVNSDGTVTLYATNVTIGDLDQTYLYTITDTLAATTPAPSESFTALVTAAAGTNIRGVAFAPSAPTSATTSTTISAGSSTASGFTVTSGSLLTVLSGGHAVSVNVLSGGTAVISGTDSGSYIAQGGTETLYGSANGDAIYGTQTVTSTGSLAGAVSNETVFNGGSVNLAIKGVTASGMTVSTGGSLILNGNISATNTVIDGGKVILESPKATLLGSILFSGSGGVLEVDAVSSPTYGAQAVISGFAAGDAIDLTYVGAGATLTSTTSGGNTIETISGGGSSASFIFSGTYASGFFGLAADAGSGTKIVAGGTTSSGGNNIFTVSSGQTAPANYIVSSGHTLNVLSGGTASGVTVLSSGTALISGSDSFSTISAGGFESVFGSAGGDAIYGTQLVSAATAVVSNETVYSGGAVELFLKGAVASGLTLNSGGSLFISGNATAEDTVINGGTIVLESPKAVLSGTVTFSGAGGEIDVTVLTNTTSGVPFGDQAVIEGFGAGDVIEVSAIGSGAALSSVISGGNTYETITGSNGSETFIFAGTGDNFQLTADGFGFETAPCFAAGTRIRTARGEIAVENLVAGDEAVLADGGLAAITWIGRRKISLRRHPRPEAVRPVLISAGALADGVPCRDLLVSPDHALFLRGHLVPAKALVNGATIRQVEREMVTYYHVELAAHAVLVAENLPAESYLETGNRGAFENGGGAMQLHPDFAQGLREAGGCAPFAEAGPVVEAARREILGRAGIAATDDPGLEILFNSGTAVINSRSAIPGQVTPDPRDQRRLGVKIAALLVSGVDVPLNHPALVEGWHALEPDGRWTDGRAVIPAALLNGSTDVDVTVVGFLAYPVGSEARAATA
jgi:hypothetical protein